MERFDLRQSGRTSSRNTRLAYPRGQKPNQMSAFGRTGRPAPSLDARLAALGGTAEAAVPMSTDDRALSLLGLGGVVLQLAIESCFADAEQACGL
jgi:hypothetical protein